MSRDDASNQLAARAERQGHHAIRLKRVYESAEDGDGTRILVDRLWPRGIKRAEAGIDLWLKDIAPSRELRQWFRHDPTRWGDFVRAYRAELTQRTGPLEQLEQAWAKGPVTLLFAAKDREHNHAVVLANVLVERWGS